MYIYYSSTRFNKPWQWYTFFDLRPLTKSKFNSFMYQYCMAYVAVKYHIFCYSKTILRNWNKISCQYPACFVKCYRL